MGLLEFIDIHDTLVTKFLKVKTVGFVEVSRDGLGVVVDHNRGEAVLAEGTDRAYGAPIELDRRADAVYSRAEDHDTAVVEADVVFDGVVCRV